MSSGKHLGLKSVVKIVDHNWSQFSAFCCQKKQNLCNSLQSMDAPKSCTKLKCLINVWTLRRSWDNCRLPFRSTTSPTSRAIMGLTFPIGIFNNQKTLQMIILNHPSKIPLLEKKESAWQSWKTKKNTEIHPFRKEKTKTIPSLLTWPP